MNNDIGGEPSQQGSVPYLEVEVMEPDLFPDSLPLSTSKDVQRAVENILSDQSDETKIQERFYKSIDPSQEFGISRTVSDKLYHLPKLLVNPTLVWQEGTTTYIIKSSTTDSLGNKITLEHRLQAFSNEEAVKLSEVIVDRLRGILHKILMAAWKLANELRQFTFKCQMTELMRLCFPEREARFQNHEKIEFYENLRALENTKIHYSRKRPTKEGKDPIHESMEIRLLEIYNKTGEKEEYPITITISVFNAIAMQKEKLAFVGAGFKNTTLSLHVDSISLAAWIQARIAQHNKNENRCIIVEEDYLIKIARLENTAKKNKSTARKRLIEKLNKLAKQGIIQAPVEKKESNIIIRY